MGLCSHTISFEAFRGVRHKVPVKYGSDEGGTFAPHPEGCVCRDGLDYWRRRHEYDRDGYCIFCNCIRPAASYRRQK